MSLQQLKYFLFGPDCQLCGKRLWGKPACCRGGFDGMQIMHGHCAEWFSSRLQQTIDFSVEQALNQQSAFNARWSTFQKGLTND